MPTAPLYCTSSTTFVDLVCSDISPISPISVEKLDLIYPSVDPVPPVFYSDLGSRLYDNDFDTDGSGTYWLLDEPSLWLNNTSFNGPFLRSAVWSNNVDYSPFNTWLGFNICFNLSEPKLYYFGFGGDDGVTLKINNNIIIEQNIGSAFTSNYRYWNIYPILLNEGSNVVEIMNLNSSGIGGLGLEIYDNTAQELRTASTIDDLSIIFSTVNKTGQTFDVVYSSGFTPSTSGYTCESGSTYMYQSCSGRCVTFSSVTTNLCTSDFIKQSVSAAINLYPGQVNSVGYGFKIINNKITDRLALIFTSPYSDPGLCPSIPKSINISGYTFDTDLRYGTFFSPQLNVPSPLPSTSCGAFSEDWKFINQPNRVNVIRPLVGGVGFVGLWNGFKNAGTMGALVVDNETNALMGLTNAHCFSPVPEFTSTKDPIPYTDPIAYPNNRGWCWFLNDSNVLQGGNPVYNFQTDQYTGYDPANIIGVATKFYPLSSIPDPFDPSTGELNKIDAALISINEEDIDYEISFRQYGMTGWTQPMDFATTQELDDLLTTKPFFYSVGGTTGPKGEGEIKLVISQNFVVFNVDGISYRNCFFQDYVFLSASGETTPNGLACTYPCWFGDSGSVVCADFNGVRKIVGLLSALTIGGITDPNPPPGWGGAPGAMLGFARIDNVASLMNISPWTGQTVNFVNPNTIIDECEPGLSSSPTLELSGSTFWQIGLCGPENGFPT